MSKHLLESMHSTNKDTVLQTINSKQLFQGLVTL